jgi:hypothetical protein
MIPVPDEREVRRAKLMRKIGRGFAWAGVFLSFTVAGTIFGYLGWHFAGWLLELSK